MLRYVALTRLLELLLLRVTTRYVTLRYVTPRWLLACLSSCSCVSRLVPLRCVALRDAALLATRLLELLLLRAAALLVLVVERRELHEHEPRDLLLAAHRAPPVVSRRRPRGTHDDVHWPGVPEQKGKEKTAARDARLVRAQRLERVLLRSQAPPPPPRHHHRRVRRRRRATTPHRRGVNHLGAARHRRVSGRRTAVPW